MRLKIFRLIIVLSFVGIAADLVYLQVIRGEYYYRLSTNNRIRVVPLEGRRGRILDRNGLVIADNRLAFDVAVIPQDVQDSEALFEYLQHILNVDKKTLQQRFYQRKVAPFAPVVIAQDLDRKTAMAVEENRFRFPGLYVQETFRREYPFGLAGAHVLGYVGKISLREIEQLQDYGYTPQSIVGKDGLEKSYDQYLRGKEGGQQIEVNHRGQQVRLLSVREPEPGEDIQVTIDQRIQNIAQTLLGDKPGVIIVLHMISGEILGAVSSPSYDPNVFVDTRMSQQAAKLFADKASPLLNRAIKGLFPPGSVFKTVVALAGLMSDKFNIHTTFNCPGYHQLGKRRFRCAHVHGPQNLLQAIEHSCNVYFYNLGMMLGPDQMYKYARLFGLGEDTHVDLPHEERGYIPSRASRRRLRNEGWHKGDTLNMSIGQGDVLVTPLQLVRMMAAVARSGVVPQPHFIKRIGEQDIIPASALLRVKLPDDVFQTVQGGLRQVVASASGTARLLNKLGRNISGKTGTAQAGGNRDHHAWFVGYDKTGKTQIAFCVFLQNGGSSYYAVKVTSDLLEEMRRAEIL